MKDVYLKAVYLKAFLVTTKGALKKKNKNHTFQTSVLTLYQFIHRAAYHML